MNVALAQCIDGVVSRLVNTIDHRRVITDADADADVQFHHLTPDRPRLIHGQLGHSKGQQKALYQGTMRTEMQKDYLTGRREPLSPVPPVQFQLYIARSRQEPVQLVLQLLPYHLAERHQELLQLVLPFRNGRKRQDPPSW